MEEDWSKNRTPCSLLAVIMTCTGNRVARPKVAYLSEYIHKFIDTCVPGYSQHSLRGIEETTKLSLYCVFFQISRRDTLAPSSMLVVGLAW
jgi:hypothetical protein